jgi:L-lactate dehydrogenase (cytochrome)
LRPREIRRLLGLRWPEWNPTRRRLARCNDIEDLRRVAKRRLPRPVFDYVEGGADEELSLVHNVAAFRRFAFHPRVLRDVSSVDVSADLCGGRAELPLVLAPTGYTRMMHRDGELAVARAAKEAGVPYTLSTVASTSIDDVAESRHPSLWFQLYVWRDRSLMRELMQRAWVRGYRVLELSIDVPVAGHRSRDAKNGLTVPPRLTGKSLLGLAMHPGYWLPMLVSPAITFANAPADMESGGLSIENVTAQFDPSISWRELEEIRELWPGHLIVKGPIQPALAREIVQVGADGIHLSNHGGRQLDRAQAPIEAVAAVRQTIGEVPIIVVDSGIRHGADLAVAVALGADAGAVGRAYLYGLVAAGQPGVAHALRLLREQFIRTVQLLGVENVAALRANGSEIVRPRFERG